MVEARTVSAPVPLRTDRNARGQFIAGNDSATRHGLYSTRLADALRAERVAFEAASLADDGVDGCGPNDLPVRRRALHRYRSRIHTMIEAISESLERFGQFDRRGKLRVGWLQQQQALIATALRLDAALGLDRRARDVSSLSPAEYVALIDAAEDSSTLTHTDADASEPEHTDHAHDTGHDDAA